MIKEDKPTFHAIFFNRHSLNSRQYQKSSILRVLTLTIKRIMSFTHNKYFIYDWIFHKILNVSSKFRIPKKMPVLKGLKIHIFKVHYVIITIKWKAHILLKWEYTSVFFGKHCTEFRGTLTQSGQSWSAQKVNLILKVKSWSSFTALLFQQLQGVH